MITKAKIQDDLHQAMKSGDKPRVQALRLIQAAIKQIEVDERIVVEADRLLEILSKMAKQRQESIAQYLKANRQDLVEQEEYELDLIHTYLPTPLSASEIAALIEEAVASTQASAIRDMGKVMSFLRPKLSGRADLALVADLIKKQLT
jgi:uncharacterized protein YqeY